MNYETIESRQIYIGKGVAEEAVLWLGNNGIEVPRVASRCLHGGQ